MLHAYYAPSSSRTRSMCRPVSRPSGQAGRCRGLPPVLEVSYSKRAADRYLYLNGRGLTLVPSYFNWGDSVAMADSDCRPCSGTRSSTSRTPRTDATALRDAGLLTSVRHGQSVLHTLTPTGASVLRAATRAAG